MYGKLSLYSTYLYKQGAKQHTKHYTKQYTKQHTKEYRNNIQKNIETTYKEYRNNIQRIQKQHTKKKMNDLVIDLSYRELGSVEFTNSQCPKNVIQSQHISLKTT